jgi:RNA repair, ligase-Pnkp-associating, region of Hen1/C-terminal region of band_7
MAKTITSFSTPGTVLQGSTSTTHRGLEVSQRGLDLPTQAVQLRVAEQYIAQFGQLAKAETTMIAPAPLSPCSGGEALLRRLFEPLGYRVQAPQHLLNERNPTWGNSEYFTVTLTGTMRLRDLLSHLYVLVPVCAMLDERGLCHTLRAFV